MAEQNTGCGCGQTQAQKPLAIHKNETIKKIKARVKSLYKTKTKLFA